MRQVQLGISGKVKQVRTWGFKSLALLPLSFLEHPWLQADPGRPFHFGGISVCLKSFLAYVSQGPDNHIESLGQIPLRKHLGDILPQFHKYS